MDNSELLSLLDSESQLKLKAPFSSSWNKKEAVFFLLPKRQGLRGLRTSKESECCFVLGVLYLARWTRRCACWRRPSEAYRPASSVEASRGDWEIGHARLLGNFWRNSKIFLVFWIFSGNFK